MAHATAESSPSIPPPGTNVVVLAVPNETHLRALATVLAQNNIPHALIREVDPPFDNQCTAIGIFPVFDRKTLKPYLSELKLFTGKENSDVLG